MKNYLAARWLVLAVPMVACLGIWVALGEDKQAPVKQAPDKQAEKATTSKNTKPAKTSADLDPGYPVLNDIELMDRLTIAGVKMLTEKTGKGSKELNHGLECRQIEMDLAPASDKPISDEALYARACESVFVICGLYKMEGHDEWEAAFATAFVVSPNGVLTTSRHFFDDPQPCDVFLVADANGNVFPVTEILCSDDKLDTCLFRIPATDLVPLPIGDKSPVPGSRVRIVSHPGYFFYFFSSGQVANYYKDDQKLRWMNVTADFGQGSSGAPAFDDCGNVIGQVASTLTLYAMGSTLEDPIVSRRKITRSATGILQASAVNCVAVGEQPKKPAADDAAPKKKRKKKKDQQPEKVLPLPIEEMADPQMVFKTCTPLESIRGMVKQVGK